MAIKRTVDNTQKLGPVTVVQSAIVADSPDNDVTNVATSNAKCLMSMQIVNGSKSGFYFKIQDTTTANSNTASHTCVYVEANSTQFVGFSRGVKFSAGISVLVSTSATGSSGTTLDGISTYTIIASDTASHTSTGNTTGGGGNNY